MLLTELFTTEAGVGIITKQNTTPDVKPGETQRQAAKLGMKLDKKNRPPLLHKSAAKNTSANKAYNLGLTEADVNGVGQDNLLTVPTHTLVVNTPGDLDWYKIGQHYPTLDKLDPKEFGQGDSDMVITFANQAEKEHFEKILKNAKVKYKDIGGTSHHPEIHETIRKEGNKYTVYNKKGDRKFGTYTSRADAEKRLRQIEMFKHIG